MRSWAFPFVVAGALGCNGIAGIADLSTGDLDGGDGGSSSTDDASSSDASNDALAPPACGAGEVGLALKVEPTAQLNGVTDNKGNFPEVTPANPLSRCFTANTNFELQADPDQSNVSHAWNGAGCGTSRRCVFTLVSAMAIDVTR